MNLYQQQKQDFNASNHVTVMSKLSRIRQMRKDDPLFEAFLADTNAKLQFWDQMVGSWKVLVRRDYRPCYCENGTGTKRNVVARQIMAFMEDRDHVDCLFENGDTQCITS